MVEIVRLNQFVACVKVLKGQGDDPFDACYTGY